MAEPSRKKKKGHKSSTTVLKIVPELNADPLYFVTSHPEKPCIVDLRPFAYGLDSNSMAARRGGSFTGRPELIAELAPVLQGLTVTAPSHTVDWYIRGLRTYWRLFDKHEGEKLVSRLEDINDLYGMLQRREGVRGSITTGFLKLLNTARARRGLPPLYWTKNDDESRIVDVPVREHIALIMSELKHRVIAARKRYETSDNLAATGRDYLEPKFLRPGVEMTEADQHATYRGMVKRSQEIVLNRKQTEALGVSNASFLRSIETFATGIYPSMADVQASFLLFVVKSGWNPQTALDIDITKDYVSRHPTAAGYHIVKSKKNRGKTIQASMGQDKSEFSPKMLLEHLIQRTGPLRAYLHAELDAKEKHLRQTPHDKTLRLQVAALKKKVCSPWLFVNPNSPNALVNALGSDNYNRSLNPRYGKTVMKSLIVEMNRRIAAANTRARELNQNVRKYIPIDAALTVTDFRDGYAAYAYEASGYNWLMVKMALGHRSYESTKIYLRKRQYKAEGEAKVLKLTSALLGDIERYRLVEPVFLFIQVERGELTDEQRQRYFNHKQRTRVGTGCADFKKPPPEIAPFHVEGKGCRVQRCTLCRHAIVFPDSLGPLTMRLAELKALREHLSILTWNESSFAEELENTEAALDLFEREVVQEHLQFWTREIAEGRHKPLDMEGSYA